MDEKAKQWADGHAQSAMGALESLLQGQERPNKTVAFPGWRGKPAEEGGKGWRVTIWALGADEVMDADAEALAFLADRFKIDRYDVKALFPVELDLETKVRQLFKALRDPDAATRPWARAVQSLRQLEPDELQALYEMVLEFTRTRSPLHHIKALGELEEVLAYLGKASTDEAFLLRFDAVTLRSIISELVARYVKPTKASSSDTSSPSDTSQP